MFTALRLSCLAWDSYRTLFMSMNSSFSVTELKTKREEDKEAELKTETGSNGSVNLYNIA